MQRSIRWIAALYLAAAGSAPLAARAEVDPNLVSALRQAVEDQTSFDDNLDALMWLADMSERLERVLLDAYYRVTLMKSIHAEATRAGLPPLPGARRHSGGEQF